MAGKNNLPGLFLNVTQKLARGIWPWDQGIRARLPMHYKLRFIARYMQEPVPVHYQPDTRKYKADRWGNKIRIENVPLPVIFPKEADEGLWGGEGIIQGFKKKANNPMKPRNAHIWMVGLTRRVFYSEILDKYLTITVTKRMMDMVDEAYGFDNYILQTHEVDLKSKLGMGLKREMLKTLTHKTMYPEDPEKCSQIYEKYQQHLIPEEEICWLGLDLYEAEAKQAEVEEDERIQNTRPLKEEFMQDLIWKIKHDELEEELETGTVSWMSKLNPFQSEKKQKEES